MAPPHPNGLRWCFQLSLGHSKYQRTSKSLYWFKSYGSFTEEVDFCPLVVLHQEGLAKSTNNLTKQNGRHTNFRTKKSSGQPKVLRGKLWWKTCPDIKLFFPPLEKFNDGWVTILFCWSLVNRLAGVHLVLGTQAELFLIQKYCVIS